MELMAVSRGAAALSPPALDRTLDLTLAARCLPAMRSGQPMAGDFYDTWLLDDHRLLIAVGDVAGHGVGAGSRMRKLRAGVCRGALWRSSPAELLGLLDETYVLGSDDDIATLWLGVYDCGTGMLSYASAGHLPPVLAEVGTRPRLLAEASAPPLGTGAVAEYVCTHEIEWPAGAFLVAYSDGLVERPTLDLDDQIDQLRGLAGLAASELGTAASPRMLAARLLDAAVPDQRCARDDVCILVLRRDTPASQLR
jgi:serine phosphatase RsbU (regulator of sigma subunit)